MMKKNKKVPVFESFRYGFLETKRHLKVLLPLSALFFVPELLHLLGWVGPMQILFGQVYKVVAFFFLLLVSIRLTGKSGTASEVEREGVEFLKGNVFKWAAMGLGFTFGGGLLAALYLYTGSPALAVLDQASLIHGAKDYVAWLWTRPRQELALTALILGYLPYRVFVAFNFFGYIVVDTGATARVALKSARKLSQGVFWGLTLFYGLCGLAHYLGFRIYVIGAVFTFPVTVLATVFVYRSLASQSEGG
jgi:hypothetical protein